MIHRKNRSPQKRAPALTNYRTKTTIADEYSMYEKNKRADSPFDNKKMNIICIY
jgi:hypothetical protein